MKKIIYLLSLIALTSCMGYTAMYQMQLSFVEAPADASVQYGEYTTIRLDSTNTPNKYTDKYIDITWDVRLDNMRVKISNKTQHTINVHWDKATFVGVTGIVQPIIHSTTHPQSSIPRHAYLYDVIMRWDKDYLLPAYNETIEDMHSNANKYKGCNFWVTLPIEIEGVINEYTFVFLVGEQFNAPEEPRYVDYSARR